MRGEPTGDPCDAEVFRIYSTGEPGAQLYPSADWLGPGKLRTFFIFDCDCGERGGELHETIEAAVAEARAHTDVVSVNLEINQADWPG